MEAMSIQYNATEWRLFIDSSKSSLKGVLLHNGNIYSSVPVTYSTETKETYASMKILLAKTKYEDHKWQICGDLKVVALVRGMQTGYTKFMCFLCCWDSRAKNKHYIQSLWPARGESVVGERNVTATPLVEADKILLSPLHIKLGLVKNFVKSIDKDSDAIKYLKTIFPHLSDAKMKEGK